MPAIPNFIVAIPARYGSTRLPGKPLRAIAGVPMVVRVAQRALQAGASQSFRLYEFEVLKLPRRVELVRASG